MTAIQPKTEPTKTVSRDWIAYVAPMVVFVILTFLEPQFPKQYVWLTIGKALAVSATLIVCRSAWRDIRFDARMILPGLLVGLAVFAEWVLIDKGIPYPHLGTRTAFNPFLAIADPTQRALFLAFRFFGLVLLVPVMEELFWRSFLLRYITTPDYATLPIGEFSWTAFAVVAALFGLAHPEWLVAVICACAYGLLLRRTRSLFACVLAHATTNLALGLYVLLTRDWRYW